MVCYIIIYSIIIPKHLCVCCRLLQAKLHPLCVLLAAESYKRGHAKRGKVKWKPNRDVVQALDSAFCRCLAVSCHKIQRRDHETFVSV